jgi:hypothetical protein
MNDGGPAFPRVAHHRDPDHLHDFYEAQEGMSLRDWFAGQALAGELATWHITTSDPAEHSDKIAQRMYRIADAMLAARVTDPPKPEST